MKPMQYSSFKTEQRRRRPLLRLIWMLAAVFFLIAPDLHAGELTISDAVKHFVETNKRMRIAVFDFANTDGAKTRFDAYLADTIVTELSRYPVTLLERKKIETLLGEQALSQTGVVDANKALKLGTLLPVDVVVSGSYTEMGNRLVVNGRFIHVGTGEILYAFASSLEIQAGSGSVKPAQAEDPKAVCERNKESVRKALYNLQDQDSVKHAVDVVVAIPFDNECGEVHYGVMHTFSRHRIFDPRYRAFLLRTLGQIDTPSDDNRANEILRFNASDGTVDQEEWEAGLAALRKMRQYALHLPLRPLLNAAHEQDALVRERVDEIMRLTAAGQIGRPVPVDDLTMLYGVMEALEIRSGKAGMASAAAVFRKYAGLVPDDDKNNKKAAEILRMMYTTESEQGPSRESLSLLASFFKQLTPSDVMGEETADLIRHVETKTEERNAEDRDKMQAYQKDLAFLRAELGGLYCLSIGTAKKKRYGYIVEERSLFVLKSGMVCEHVPTVKDLEAEMRSGDWDRKLKAAETLSKIGAAAKPAEKTVIRYLGQQGFGNQGGRMRRFCAVTLGNIATTDPEAIARLIESFPDFGDGVSSEAEEAIAKIGAAAMPQLIQGLDHKEHAVRFRCAKALGALGSRAKQALPALQRIAAKDEDPYVRKEAQGAVQMISSDF